MADFRIANMNGKAPGGRGGKTPAAFESMTLLTGHGFFFEKFSAHFPAEYMFMANNRCDATRDRFALLGASVSSQIPFVRPGSS